MSISVQKVSKNYNNQIVLDMLSFDIPNNQIVGFLGPNGAGKSTMMKILTGYISNFSGKVYIDNLDVRYNQIAVKQKIGYLPEHNPLYLDMYIKEFLDFIASIYNSPKDRIKEVISLTNLEPEIHKKIHQLSKGFRQRVGLAAAMVHDPKYLILDEPTTGLDPNQLIEIRSLIKNISASKTILLSTHIMQEVEAICDRVIIMNKGNIVADKMLDELVQPKQQIIYVEFDFSVEIEAFKRLDKVVDAKEIGLHQYQLYFDTEKDMRSYVFDFAHDIGLKIKTLKLESKNLEDLFTELTH